MACEKLTRLPGGMLRYSYMLDDDRSTTLESFTLTGMAEPYRERFFDKISNQDWIVEFDRKLPESPYRADFLICTVDAAI